jgi:iron complex outermembrane receptor protein
MKVKHTPIAAAVALALMSAAVTVQAQEEKKEEKAQQLEAVVVKGIRASLRSAAATKKAAKAVVDAVTAEDIGKLPDSDVGQSLGRIPGISVGRAFGQGASVSIRGSDPQMTYTTLNGQTVASTGWYDQLDIDRSFNYSLLPPELIGGMEVYKSSQANLTEGGIGGTVIVKSRKSLDLKPNQAFVSAKLGKGSISGPEKELSGLYNFRNDQKTFGVLAAAAVSNGTYIRNGIEADTRWSGDVAPTAFVQERKRSAFNVALQARPNQSLEFGLNLLNLKLGANNSNSSDYIFPDANCTLRNTAVKSNFNPDGICLKSTTTDANKLGTWFYQNWARKAEMTSNSLTFDAKLKLESARFDFVAGMTKAEGGTNLTTNFAYGSWGITGFSGAKWRGTIDATGDQIKLSPTADQSFDASYLPGKSTPETWAVSRAPNKDQEKFAQIDATFDTELGAINAFKAGARFADHTFEKRSYRPTFKKPLVEVATSSLFSGSVKAADWNVPKPNMQAMFDATNANITGWIEDRSAFSELNEKNTSLYGMFEFEATGVRGNFGLRYISTSAKSSTYLYDGTALATGDLAQNGGWSASKKGSTDSKYNDVLPSVNVSFDLNKNAILRAAASQTVTRPNFANMLGVSVSGYNDDRAGNEVWTVGNVALKPMKSTNVDLSLEYYYGKGNLASATYFNKDINNFITSVSTPNQKVGLVDPKTGKDDWTKQSFVNAGGGRIQGLELQTNHTIGDGYGVIANYTFTDGSAPGESYLDKLGVFTQASKHNANLVGYFENDQFNARLAYNWRSKYMIREGAFWYGNRWHKAFGSLDANVGWNINDKLKLGLEATNLLAADDVQYGAADASNTAIKDPLRAGYPAWSFKGERTFKLVLSAQL